MKSLLRLLTNKILVVILVMVLEFVLILTLMWNLSLDYRLIYSALLVLSVLGVIYVFNRHDNPAYQLAWAIVILALSPMGIVTYFIFGNKKAPKKLRERLDEIYPQAVIPHDETLLADVHHDYPNWGRTLDYIHNTTHYPIYKQTQGTYLKSGEVKFAAMLEALESAQSFIFMEYFIVKDGVMWQTVLEVLKRKRAEGVDVRLIFDDWGTALFTDLKKQCRDAGLEPIFFNPLIPRLAIQINNRNHRKICVVDGRIGIVGGINLADEYINIGSKFGHWKDTAVMIEGEAVYSLTLMFLHFYSYYTKIEEDPLQYRYHFPKNPELKGYVMPFSDTPTDELETGMDVHLSMINRAERYIYIQTPYLIVGYEMISALVNTARSGVDVRIVVPHIPDKKMVNQVTKSNYDILVANGVKIYEYVPGFVHSKTVVVDDEICSVGTINMDFRSYYMHYECSIMFLDHDVVQACYDDFQETLTQSIEITQEMLAKTPVVLRWWRSILRLFSGLM